MDRQNPVLSVGAIQPQSRLSFSIIGGAMVTNCCARCLTAPRKPVEAMDVIEWTGERTFNLGGRRDGAVQIGAVNVFPAQVTDALGEHPRIKECRVKAGRRGDGVNRLIAHIVLKPEFQPNDQTAREIDAWCRMKLRQQERPRIYNFEKSLSK